MGELFSTLGTIVTVVGTATAITGGVTAGPGETVVTGASSALVEIHQTINANEVGGVGVTEILTTEDGVTKKETITKTFAPGEPVVLNVAASSSSKGTISSATSTPATSSMVVPAQTFRFGDFRSFFTSSISRVFERVFSFFRF